MNHLIVYCEDADDVQRLFDFVREHENDYKFIRKYSRAMTFKNLGKRNGRVFSCKDEKAEFKMRLMFNTSDYVI